MNVDDQGRYVVERDLGEQPVGRFQIAIDSKQGGRVTIVRPRVAGHDALRFVERMSREIEKRNGLHDTAYCTVRDVGIALDGDVFLAVERPQGVPLSALLDEEERLSADRALSLAIQLCDHVQRAHGLGIFTAPISLESIIVDLRPNGVQRVALVDLGFTRGPLAELGEFGRPELGHVAPQRLRGEDPDARDDVFTVTAVLHRMLFGVAPPVMSAYGPADGSGWPMLPDAGRGLDRRLEPCLHTVLLKGLARERGDRFERIEALQRALVGLRQLMQLTAPAFELLAATRGRQGRRTGGAVELLREAEPGLNRARKARARIREVVAHAVGGRATLSDLDARRAEPVTDASGVVNGRRPRLSVVVSA